ncbi:MAG: efflux RND transporter periplasmic adaptor subunit [Tibeticola sp.]
MNDSKLLHPQQRARRAAAALSALALLGLAACSPPPAEEPPLRAVKLITVGASPLVAQREYAAEVRARVESRLGFRVAGKITRRAVEPGQPVKAGQLLAEIDPSDYRLATEAARAQVAAAQTQRDLAAAELKRYTALREQNFISGAELERREAAFKAAQATLEQAQAQLALQGNQAGYTRLVADAAGVVTGIDADVGQVVAAGAPVVRVAQDGARDVVFNLPEDKLATVAPGLKVTVRAWADGREREGVVREIAAAADPLTRTYRVKVGLAGAEQPALGATASVLLPAPMPAGAPLAAIKLPTTALRQEGGHSAVWVFDAASSTVLSQPVEVATADGNEVVIAAGLKPGQQVVATGVHVLSPGQKVLVYQEKYADPIANRTDVAPEKVVPGAASAAAAAASGTR